MPDDLPVPETIPDNIGMVLSPNRSLNWSGKYAYDGGCELSFFTLFARRTPLREPLVKAILHVDIDNTAPLNVVSLHLTQESQNPLSLHVIGRVNKNKSNLSVPVLVVDDLHFIGVTPGMTLPVELEVTLSRAPGSNPQAEVSFYDRSNRKEGPIKLKRISTYFREVEVEIDREQGAENPESYYTHLHPHRPPNLKKENLKIESVFAKSGINITRSAGSGIIDASGVSGGDTWTKMELHDAMYTHWSARANIPQWKMWILLSNLTYETDYLYAGLMFDENIFDENIKEREGYDRQGTVIFTHHHFHCQNGPYYKQYNHPKKEAAQRQLFFSFIHEIGHAFNLAHPHDMYDEPKSGWAAPPWTPNVIIPTTNRTKHKYYTWMNYPWVETKGFDLSSFYNQFRFQFNDAENLFLRHAPAPYVQMGNESFFQNHGIVSPESLDPRLEFVVRSRKPVMELGEPVFVELRLRNKSDETVTVQEPLDLSTGIVQLAITNPKGERHPYIPFIRSLIQLCKKTLNHDDDPLYESVNLTMGKFGFPFKVPGSYRIEASYRNLDGRTAKDVTQLWVRAPSQSDDISYLDELFNSSVGRVLYVGGTRMMKDVNEKIDRVCTRIGESHPAIYYLTAARFMPYAKSFKLIQADEKKIKILKSNPDFVLKGMKLLVDKKYMPNAADAIGHITYRKIVEAYVNCAQKANQKPEARRVMNNLLELFENRKVIPSVIKELRSDVKKLS